MSSSLQKTFQRKIADNSSSEDEGNNQPDHEEESDSKQNPPAKLGFTEEKVDYHSDSEQEKEQETQKNTEGGYKKTTYKTSGYHKNHHKKKEFYKMKPQKEYVVKSEATNENEKEEKNKNFYDFKEPKEKSYKTNKKTYMEYGKKQYDVVYVEKKNEDKSSNSDTSKKISFNPANLKNIKEFVPENTENLRPKPKGLKLNKDAQEFKINEEGVINSNYLEDEEESTHVFIGFQQPLDLMTHNPPQVVPIQPNNNYYLPNQNIYNQQIPMNFQGFYPNNNYNYYG